MDLDEVSEERLLYLGILLYQIMVLHHIVPGPMALSRKTQLDDREIRFARKQMVDRCDDP